MKKKKLQICFIVVAVSVLILCIAAGMLMWNNKDGIAEPDQLTDISPAEDDFGSAAPELTIEPTIGSEPAYETEPTQPTTAKPSETPETTRITETTTAMPTQEATTTELIGLNGYHTQKYNNGDEYSGNFVNGVRSGHGTYKWANGTVYIGEFVNGEPSGQGDYTYPTTTTQAPTEAPTTEPPPTEAPTDAPTTEPPTTVAETTTAVPTEAPTIAPKPIVPTTEPPTTQAPEPTAEEELTEEDMQVLMEALAAVFLNGNYESNVELSEMFEVTSFMMTPEMIEKATKKFTDDGVLWTIYIKDETAKATITVSFDHNGNFIYLFAIGTKTDEEAPFAVEIKAT